LSSNSGGDFGGAADDQRFGVGDFRVDGVLGGQDDVPAGLLLEELHSSVADLVGYR